MRRGLGCVCKSTGRPPNGAGCPCPNGQTHCGGRCVDPARDLANCGGCGIACSPSADPCRVAGCRNGACTTIPAPVGTRCEDGEFASRVTEASARVLGGLAPATARAAFPLRLMHARRYAGPRIALVGDAAHTVHPLAGQGINLAFLDAAALVDVVGDALAAGDDPGEERALRRYERWRKSEALPAMALLDGIKRLYSGSNPLQSRLRRGALGLAQSSATVKRLLMRRALGVAGDVPASVRPPPS